MMMGSEDPNKQKVVMGYPSMDRYHLQAQTAAYPQQPPPPVYPVPCHPQGYATSSFQHHPAPPPPSYLSSSFHPQAYNASSSFQKGKFVAPSSKNPYSPSFNEFYYNQQPPFKPLQFEKESSTSFGRVMLILMIILVSCMCMMSLVMWFLFGTYIPEFEVVSLKISNLTTTNGTVTGVWDASLTVKNSNEDLTIHFEHVRSSIFYKEMMLGMSNLQPFMVPKREMTDLNATVDADPSLGVVDKSHESAIQSLANERNATGVAMFSLRLAMNANFTSPTLVYRQEALRVMCENLRVSFSPEGEGHLAQSGLDNACLIRLRDTLD